jgi:hypothetical protein
MNKLILLMALVAVCACEQQAPTETENLKAFSKAYGYVKYFHPSDEAANTDWNLFAIYGAQETGKCRSKDQLINTLNELFNPIAPSVRFTAGENEIPFDVKNTTPPDPQNYRLTYWQHKGVGTGMVTTQYQSYKSIRVNRQTDTIYNKLFDYTPRFGEVISKEISDGIFCQVPIVLYCNDKSTFPQSDSAALKKLRSEIAKVDFDKAGQAAYTGNVINIYNVMQHFYPYFDVVDVDWDKEFNSALQQSLKDKTKDDHLLTIIKFTATLKDGHVSVSYKGIGPFAYSPPVSWEMIEGKLVITKTFGVVPGIKVGDIVTEVDGMSPEKLFDKFNPLIPAPTQGWHDFLANQFSLGGQKGSIMKLKIDGKIVELIRAGNNYNRFEFDGQPYEMMRNNVMYLSVSKLTADNINALMPRIKDARAIICDARGYPKGFETFIMHLMQKDDTTKAWMQVPLIVYPDHEKTVAFEKHSWISFMKARKPYLGNKKIIYIVDSRAISYAESCLGYVEGYKLATIIGQPSAGTNGNVNSFNLPGGYYLRFTGMKVVKHNGSQHHNVGIKPDIYLTKTVQAVKEGRDEFLEKALELANK